MKLRENCSEIAAFMYIFKGLTCNTPSWLYCFSINFHSQSNYRYVITVKNCGCNNVCYHQVYQTLLLGVVNQQECQTGILH